MKVSPKWSILLLVSNLLFALPSWATNDGVAFTEQEKESAAVATDVIDLSDPERAVFYYVNLVRLAPKTFAQKYVRSFDGSGDRFAERRKSLYRQLMKMKPVGVLEPDQMLLELAQCFASEAGAKGIMGHSREGLSCETWSQGECRVYGENSALNYVLSLLVDAEREEGGDRVYRKALLDGNNRFMGCAIRDHKTAQKNLVIDFAKHPNGYANVENLDEDSEDEDLKDDSGENVLTKKVATRKKKNKKSQEDADDKETEQTMKLVKKWEDENSCAAAKRRWREYEEGLEKETEELREKNDKRMLEALNEPLPSAEDPDDVDELMDE